MKPLFFSMLLVGTYIDSGRQLAVLLVIQILLSGIELSEREIRCKELQSSIFPLVHSPPSNYLTWRTIELADLIFEFTDLAV